MKRADSRNKMPSITRTDLVKVLSRKQEHLAQKDIELAVRSLINLLSDSLSSGRRIEVRGFGSFDLHYHPSRIARNPRTGDSVHIRSKYVPYFKPGKELRKRIQ